MKQSVIKLARSALLVLGVILLAVSGTFVSPGAASAAGCRHTDVGMNNGYHTNQWAYIPNGSVVYWYTDWVKSPSWATSCRDVNINYVSVPGDTTSGQCVLFRAVRQYDMRASGWTTVCPGSGWRVIFSGIYGNTYRVEAQSMANPVYRPYYSIMD